MAERLTPGVYVEEVAGTVRPIQGVSTSNAAFVGEAPRGIPNRAEFVSGYMEFERRFGGHRRGEAGFLAQAVEAFFAAGGRRAYVVRVVPSNAETAASSAVPARADDAWGVRHNVLQFAAQGAGAWSEHIRIHLEGSTAFAGEAFRVRVEWTEAGRSRTVERFDNVRSDPESEDYAVRVINETSRYLRVTDLFQTEFVDAAERDSPPLPERAPRLVTVATSPDTYVVPIGARLTVSWNDVINTAVGATATILFDEAVGAVDGRNVVLTAAELEGVVATALGANFRVTRDGDDISIEAAVAGGAYLVAGLQDGRDDFDLAGATAVTVTVTDGAAAGQRDYPVDVTNDNALTPRALADRLATVLAAADNPFGVAADAAGRDVVLTAPAGDAGVVLAISVTGAAVPWTDPRPAGGQPGVQVDSLADVEIRVSEVQQLGVARVLGQLFPVVRGVGRTENDPTNPDLRPAETGDSPIRLLGGTDGTGAVGAADYAGTVTTAGRTGLRALDTVTVNMLALPGRTEPDFLTAAMTYCDRNDAFFLADGVGSVDPDFEISADEVRQIVEGLPSRSNNAAIYYPWIEVSDPVGIGRNPRRVVPPSGHVAGVFARTDATRGVWKAPAGIEALVNGAVDVQHRLVDADQDLLNPIGLNCIRQFPNVGIVSWGARTLASDPEWRYVPVRRTALFLKASLRRGLQWAVFEPNDQDLWDRIRINISAFMLGLFRQRAFQGATPDEAFAVKCDRETNPQELVDQGIVTARVAFAPLKPAEFVVIEISQKSLLAI